MATQFNSHTTLPHAYFIALDYANIRSPNITNMVLSRASTQYMSVPTISCTRLIFGGVRFGLAKSFCAYCWLAL